jgi:hypothetical protein
MTKADYETARTLRLRGYLLLTSADLDEHVEGLRLLDAAAALDPAHAAQPSFLDLAAAAGD